MEIGNPSNPLKISWLSEKPSDILKSNVFSPQCGDSETSTEVSFILILSGSFVYLNYFNSSLKTATVF